MTMSTTTDRQQTFQFTPGHETREQRMQRILAGVPQVRRASDLTFTDRAYRAATRKAKYAEQVAELRAEAKGRKGGRPRKGEKPTQLIEPVKNERSTDAKLAKAAGAPIERSACDG